MSRARPARRWFHASTGLDDFALVTWPADPERLGRLLPAGFEPDVRAGVALVSAVAFRADHFRFNVAPWPRVSGGQVDYRAYVRRGDETGVWSLGSSFDNALVAVPRMLWRMPWHRDRVGIVAEWDGDAGPSWRLGVTGAWGEAAIALRGTGGRFVPPAGFADATAVSAVLLDPVVGWYGRRDGSGVGRYSVWHPPLEPVPAEVDAADARVLTDLGLVEPGAGPVSAGLQRRVHLDVHTPPTRVRS
jgi:hypothetical protein